MWRAEGYREVSALAKLFAFQGGMHRETQEKLASNQRRRLARRDAIERARHEGREKFRDAVPTDEDVAAIDDSRVKDGALREGSNALYYFLLKTPLFLVGPNEVVPVSNSIVGSRPFFNPSLLLFTKDRFTVSAKEVTEMAEAAKLVLAKATRLGLSAATNSTLTRLIEIGEPARALLPYEGYSLSVRECDAPTSRAVEKLLHLDAPFDAGRGKAAFGDSLLDAMDCFDVCFPGGKGVATWSNVENSTGYSRRTLVRAFQKFGRASDGQRVGELP